jgi:hypothetical protein
MYGLQSRLPNSMKKLIVCFLLTGRCVLPLKSELQAISRGGCFGAAAAEYLVPGLGYAITKQWDKSAVFGSVRWYSYFKANDAYDSEYYQEDPDDIYHTTDAEDSESGKTETTVTLTKETWEAQFYSNIWWNMLLVTWGDLYQFNCQENKETYSLMLAPFRLDHFYYKWQFWLPVVVALANYYTFDDDSIVEYHLERGLTKDDLNRDTFSQYYLVGVGEEMFFRGVVQHYFFESFRDHWNFSPGASRHLSILGASAVFAVAHSGSGFTATPAVAFLFGLYEGYVYHPSLEEFDLITAIAIHSWWDLIVSYAILNHAEFTESSAKIEVPLLKIGFRF